MKKIYRVHQKLSCYEATYDYDSYTPAIALLDNLVEAKTNCSVYKTWLEIVKEEKDGEEESV